MSFLLAQGPLPVGSLIALLVFGIAILLVMILRFKLQAFLSLLVASIVVATGAVFVNGKAEKVSIESGSSTAEAITLTAPGHGRSVGAKIAISGCEPGAYNGKWTVASVPDEDTLTLNYKKAKADDDVPGALVKGEA